MIFVGVLVQNYLTVCTELFNSVQYAGSTQWCGQSYLWPEQSAFCMIVSMIIGKLNDFQMELVFTLDTRILFNTPDGTHNTYTWHVYYPYKNMILTYYFEHLSPRLIQVRRFQFWEQNVMIIFRFVVPVEYNKLHRLPFNHRMTFRQQTSHMFTSKRNNTVHGIDTWLTHIICPLGIQK